MGQEGTAFLRTESQPASDRRTYLQLVVSAYLSYGPSEDPETFEAIRKNFNMKKEVSFFLSQVVVDFHLAWLK